MMDRREDNEVIDDLITLFELGVGAESLDDLVPPELAAAIPDRHRDTLTMERLGGMIDKSISALDSPAARETARDRWHAVKVAMLSAADPEARSAAALSLAADDLDDPVVFERFRNEVEHGNPEVVLCYAEAFAENVDDAKRDGLAVALTEYAETLAARSSTLELTVLLQTLGAIYTRARVPAPRDVLTRLAVVAGQSLIWEPEPAMLCTWSISTSGAYDLLILWLQEADGDLASFATWVASKVVSRQDSNVSLEQLRPALRAFVVSRNDEMENPRAAAAVRRARELIGAV